jgi:uncharacterized protein RhaS with RHS repeats
VRSTRAARITYSYDTLNRLTTLAPPSIFTTGSFGFSYDALSRRTQMTHTNSVATNYTYDNLLRLAGGHAFEVGLNFRVADPSRFFEGSQGLIEFSSVCPQLS